MSDNESPEIHVDDSCSSEDDSLNPDDRSVISVDFDDDDYEDLTKSALNSLLQPNIEFDALSPKSKNRASCQCGECGFDARGSHHSCYECKSKMMVFLIYSCCPMLSLMSFVKYLFIGILCARRKIW